MLDILAIDDLVSRGGGGLLGMDDSTVDSFVFEKLKELLSSGTGARGRRSKLIGRDLSGLSEEIPTSGGGE